MKMDFLMDKKKFVTYDKFFKVDIDLSMNVTGITPVKGIVHGPFKFRGELFFSICDSSLDPCWRTYHLNSGMKVMYNILHTYMQSEKAAMVVTRSGFQSWVKKFRHIESLIEHKGYNTQGIRYTVYRNKEEVKSLFNFNALDLPNHYDEIKKIINTEENYDVIDTLLSRFIRERNKYLRLTRKGNKAKRQRDGAFQEDSKRFIARIGEDLSNWDVTYASHITYPTEFRMFIHKFLNIDYDSHGFEIGYNEEREISDFIEKLDHNQIVYLMRTVTDNGKYIPFLRLRGNTYKDNLSFFILSQINNYRGFHQYRSSASLTPLIHADKHKYFVFLIFFYRSFDKELYYNYMKAIDENNRRVLASKNFVSFVDFETNDSFPVFIHVPDEDCVVYKHKGFAVKIVKQDGMMDKSGVDGMKEVYFPYTKDYGIIYPPFTANANHYYTTFDSLEQNPLVSSSISRVKLNVSEFIKKYKQSIYRDEVFVNEKMGKIMSSLNFDREEQLR